MLQKHVVKNLWDTFWKKKKVYVFTKGNAF